MENKKMGVLGSALIWFGAAVSIAEILAGTYIAPLGMAKGVAAIVIGHVIGCALLFLAGLVGALSKKSAMDTAKLSFGRWGGHFFAILNIVQLSGWTAIMIYDGANAANSVFASKYWAILIGALIVAWIALGITNLRRLNVFAMGALFILTIILCRAIFFSDNQGVWGGESISFIAAVELSIAMPLSWIPLISDYTKDASKRGVVVSVATYGLVSAWMYAIGMGAAIVAGQSDIAAIMVNSGLGAAALGIIVLSTVTTTFLDAYSAGISAKSINAKLNVKLTGIFVALLGTAAAASFAMDNITDFLYFIGSVFAPMIAVIIADFFVLKSNSADQNLNITKLAVWLAGFVIYRLLMLAECPLGYTLPDIAITFALALAAQKLLGK